MSNELVKWIVGTYNLPLKLQDRVVRIATRQLEERGLLSLKDLSVNEQHKYFSELYRHIDELVEKFQFPFKELSDLRLDSLITPDSRYPFHDIIGFDDYNQNRISGNGNGKHEITVKEAIELLRGRIDDSALELMLKLSSYNGSGSPVFGLSPEYIVANADKIQQRLEILAKKAEQDGSIVLPRRPVVYVQFGGLGKVPFYIRFGRRNYHGNPKAIFRENIDVYKDRSRWGLAQFDKPLYEALRANGQLDEVIPIRHINALPQEEISKITLAYIPCGGIIAKIAETTGHNKETVTKYLRKNDLKTKGRLTKEQKDMIGARYTVVDGNASEAKKILGYRHTETICRVWKSRGLEPQGKPGHKKPFDITGKQVELNV